MFGQSAREQAEARNRKRELRIQDLQRERQARVADLHARIPRLAEIEREIAQIGMLMAKSVAGQGYPTQNDLITQGMGLSLERRQIMQAGGIDPAEYDVKWDCPACQNTGWLAPEPTPQGTVYPPQKCECLMREEIADMYKAAGMGGPLRKHTFDNFNVSLYPPEDRHHMSKLFQRVRTFATNVASGVEQDMPGLVLSGTSGLGKTHLASAIANHAIAAKNTVLYATAGELMELLRAARNNRDEGGAEFINRLYAIDLLVIDDLGAERVTDFVLEELFGIVNSRVNQGLPFVISTNLDMYEIENKYGQRVASRLAGGMLLPFRGDDLRVERQRG